MCWFISGTLPKAADLTRVRSVAGPEGNVWRELDDPAVAQQLPQGLGYFDVTGSGCDCQTVLGSAALAKGQRRRMPRAAARWSETKKRRWLEQRHLLIGAEEASVDGNAIAWLEYLKRVVAVVPQGPVGLLRQWGNERRGLTVRAPVPIGAVRAAELLTMEVDTLYQFVSKEK